MISYLKLFNNNPALETLSQFADFYKIRFSNKYKLENFFELNRYDIFSQYSGEQKQNLALSLDKSISELTSEDIKIDMKLPCPCYLFIEEKYISYSLIAKNTNFQVPSVSAIAFENEEIKKILQNEGVEIGLTKRMNPGCRVIGWFKTMHFSYKDVKKNTDLDDIYNLKQTFLDLSKYVVSLNTSVNQSGGSFTISFPHIPLYSINNIFSNNYSKQESEMGNVGNIKAPKNLVSGSIKSSVNTFDYFNWLMQANDLLFISFDDTKGLVNENIAGHTFDMIGLIDSVSLSKNPQGGLTVDVSGRDLMKIITEDSSIFYYQGVSAGNADILKSYDNIEAASNKGDLSGILFNGSSKHPKKNILRQLTGSINIFACEPNDFSIDFVIKTVMSHLANMSVVPDDLFVSWGDRRTTVSVLTPQKV